MNWRGTLIQHAECMPFMNEGKCITESVLFAMDLLKLVNWPSKRSLMMRSDIDWSFLICSSMRRFSFFWSFWSREAQWPIVANAVNAKSGERLDVDGVKMQHLQHNGLQWGDCDVFAAAGMIAASSYEYTAVTKRKLAVVAASTHAARPLFWEYRICILSSSLWIRFWFMRFVQLCIHARYRFNAPFRRVRPSLGEALGWLQGAKSKKATLLKDAQVAGGCAKAARCCSSKWTSLD